MFTNIERYLKVVPTASMVVQFGPGFKNGYAAWIESELLDTQSPASQICDTVEKALRGLNKKCCNFVPGDRAEKVKKNALSQQVLSELLHDIGFEIRIRCLRGEGTDAVAFVGEYRPDSSDHQPHAKCVAGSIAEVFNSFKKSDRVGLG